MKTLLSALLIAATTVHAQNLIVNGSFENGLPPWTFTGGLSLIGPDAFPPIGVDGTHVVSIGGADIPNSTLSQTFAVATNTDYLVQLYTASGGDGYTGRTSIVRVDIVTSGNSILASRSFTNVSVLPLSPASGFVKGLMTFTSPTNAGTVTLRITDTSPSGGIAVDPNVDKVSVEILPVQSRIRVSQVEVSWFTVTNKTYQAQYRSGWTTNHWTDFGNPLPGTGAPMSLLYSIPADEPQRFFRIVNAP